MVYICEAGCYKQFSNNELSGGASTTTRACVACTAAIDD